MFLKCNIGSNLAKRYPGKSGLIMDGAVFLGRIVRGKKTSTFLRLDVADATFSFLVLHANKTNQSANPLLFKMFHSFSSLAKAGKSRPLAFVKRLIFQLNIVNQIFGIFGISFSILEIRSFALFRCGRISSFKKVEKSLLNSLSAR